MGTNLLQVIDDIIAFSNSAATLYDKLADLEYHDQVNSKEYLECFDLLRMIKEMEDKKYALLKYDTPFMQDHLAYLYKSHDLLYQDMLFTLTSIDKKDLGLKRFLSKSQTIASKRNETMVPEMMSPEEMEAYRDEIENKLGGKIEFVQPQEYNYFDCLDAEMDAEEVEKEKRRNEVEILRNEALSHTYIAYLNDYIRNCKSKKIKKELLKVKYRTICFNMALEDYFLERGPNFVMPKLFQRCIEVDIDKKREAYNEVYLDFLEAEIEEAVKELDSIVNVDLPLNEGGLRALVESIYTRACNSINPSYELEGSLEVLKQNALKTSKSDYAKQKILDSFDLKKELTITKNVDL